MNASAKGVARMGEKDLRAILKKNPHLVVVGGARPGTEQKKPGASEPPKKQSKYRNTKVALDGFVFDSKKEADRYCELMVLQRIKEISEVRVHVPFPVHVNGVKICTYEADFTYKDKEGALVVEDVKSVHTRTLRLYRLKMKLLKAATGIDIIEVVQ